MHTRSTWIETSIGLPSDRPQDWVTQTYTIAGRELRLLEPRDPDRLLDDPAVRRASQASDYMPYWAFLWPGALLLAEHVLLREWPAGTRAAEIGCGLGLAGVAALARGVHVTFTDYSPAALAIAEHNARLNGFDQFATRIIDWQSPPAERFDVVLGADVLYEARCLPDVLRVLDAMLAAAGVALLADPGRAVADPFEAMATDRGYAVARHAAGGRSPAGTRIDGRIFEVRPARSHRH